MTDLDTTLMENTSGNDSMKPKIMSVPYLQAQNTES